MSDMEPESSQSEKDYSDFDKAIEEDIKRLKRSSNILILLGTLVVALLFFVIGFRVYLSLLNNTLTQRQGDFYDTFGKTKQRQYRL